MRSKNMRAGLFLTGLAALGFASWFAMAGNLEPPGSPSSTMQTSVRASDLPLTITAPGLYVLEEDIDAAGAGGITISADGVTLDLRGHSLRNGSGPGILTSGSRKNLEVRNGTVSGWGATGVFLANADNSLVINVRAEGNGLGGILVGDDSAVIDSLARSNLGDGIRGGVSCTITGCTATLNGNVGIYFLAGSIVTGCAVRTNSTAGIFAANGSTVMGCTAYSNGTDGIHATTGSVVTDCTASLSGDDGIVVVGSALVQGNTAHGNTGDGIEVGDDATVIGNNCDDNRSEGGPGGGGGSAGIHAVGSRTRIEGNNVTNNNRGIFVEGSFNIIIKNTATGNSIDYLTLGGPNSFGPIILVQGVDITTTNPWANFIF